MTIKIIGNSLWFFDCGDAELRHDSDSKANARVDLSYDEMKELREAIDMKLGDNIDSVDPMR